MKKNKIGFKSAIAMVKSKRPGVCPNLGFEMQLKKYEIEVLRQREQQRDIPKPMKMSMVERRG